MPWLSRPLSSVHSTPTDLKRFSQVPLDSSAARIPLPLATIAAAVFESNALSMRESLGLVSFDDGEGRKFYLFPYCAVQQRAIISVQCRPSHCERTRVIAND